MRDSDMIRLLLIMNLCLFGFTGSEAARVIYEGTQPADSHSLRRLAENNRVETDSLRTLLVNRGYLDAVIRREGDTVYIRAGERIMLTSITWTSDSTVQSFSGVPFTQANIEELIEQKLQRYRRQGYYYSSAGVLDVSRAGDDVSLSIRFSPGPRLTLRESIFTGLKRTRPELVKKYVAFGEGRVLTEENLAYAEKRAAAIPFVDFQPPLKIRAQPGYTGADLEFVFEEKKQVLFSGGGGIVPGTSSSVVWNLDLKFQNIFGGGRTAGFKSEKRAADRQVLEVSYRQPVLVLGLGEAGLSAATRDYRDQFYEFSVRGDFRTRISRAFGAGFEVGWRSVEPSNDLPSYRTVHTAFTIDRSTLDNPVNPSSGLNLAWTISFGYRRYDRDSLDAGSRRISFNETRSTVRAQWFQRLKGKLIGHVALNYFGLETGEKLPPLSELHYVGGPGSLRGYRNEQFVALRTAFGTFEPRVRFESGYLFVFLDAAYINNRVADSDDRVVTDEIYRYSYGLGTTVIDRARSVKISVGWNPDSAFDQPRLSLEFSADI